MHFIKNIKCLSFIWLFLLLVIVPKITFAHIDLISPPPLLGGAEGGHALKAAPFGAPNVNIAEVTPTMVKSGSEIELDIDVFIYHPGNIVVLYTTDMSGSDVDPVYEISNLTDEVPHNNFLARIKTPCPLQSCKPGRKAASRFKMKVTLPEITGDVILVVRQVMTDKLDKEKDGSVGLGRVYYHQAAKLHLTP